MESAVDEAVEMIIHIDPAIAVADDGVIKEGFIAQMNAFGMHFEHFGLDVECLEFFKVLLRWLLG